MASPTSIDKQTTHETEKTKEVKGENETNITNSVVTKEEKKAALTQEARNLVGFLVQELDQVTDIPGVELQREMSITFSKTPLKAFSTSETVTYNTFKTSGGIRCIILAVQKYCNISSIVEHGCQALLTFTLLDNNLIREMLILGAVESIISSVQAMGDSKSVDAKVAALKMLRALTQEEESRVQIWNAGGVQVISHVMTQSSRCPRTLSHSALVLSNLAFGNKNIKDAVGLEGGIATIAKAMRDHSDFQAMQARGSLALRNLSFGSEANQQIGGEAGAAESLVGAIQRFEDDREIVHQSCMALGNLSNENVENRKRIVAAGGTAVLIKLMQKFAESATMHDDCLLVLRNIATESQQAQEEAGNYGGIGVILSALDKFRRDEKVCEKGCAALRYLCFLTKNRERVARLGGMEGMIKVLKAHLQDRGVVEHALLAIGNATFESDENKEHVGNCGGIPTIVKAVEQNRLDVDIQEHGCRVLRNLVDDMDTNCDLAVQGGAITMGVFAMMGFADKASVQEQACAMLLNMAHNNEVLEKLRQADVMRLAERALVNHSKNRGVQLQAGLLIDRLNGFVIKKKSGDENAGTGKRRSSDIGSGRGGRLKARGWPFGRRNRLGIDDE